MTFFVHFGDFIVGTFWIRNISLKAHVLKYLDIVKAFSYVYFRHIHQENNILLMSPPRLHALCEEGCPKKIEEGVSLLRFFNFLRNICIV